MKQINKGLIIKRILLGTFVIVFSLILSKTTIVVTNQMNEEYAKYLNLNASERIEYNCTKDTIYFSGESNEWSRLEQDNCKLIRSLDIK